MTQRFDQEPWYRAMLVGHLVLGLTGERLSC